MTKFPLIYSKLVIPDLPKKSLYTKRIQKLAIEKNKVSILSAPAGFGKTTAVLLSLQKHRSRTRWYRLEREDGFLPMFYTHFIECLFGGEKSAEAESFSLLESIQNLEEDYLLMNAQIAEDAALIYGTKENAQKIYLVLDDFHHVQDNPKIIEIMQYFFINFPDCFSFVFTTRRRPRIVNAKLALREDLRMIESRDLSFSTDEINELVKSKYKLDLSPKQMDYLMTHSEGWIAGIYMICQGFRLVDKENEELLRLRSGAAIFSLFLSEFMENLEKEKRQILIYLSQLEDFSAEELSQVFGLHDADGFIKWMETGNLYIQKIADSPVRCRFHSLFREELEILFLKTVSIEAQKKLFTDLALFYSERDAAKSIRYLLKAGLKKEAYQIVRDKGEEYFVKGTPEQMFFLLQEFNEEQIEEEPYLLLFCGMLSINTDRANSYRLLIKAMKGFRRSKNYSFLMNTFGMMLVFAYQNNNFSHLEEASKEIRMLPILLSPKEVRIKLIISIFISLTGRDLLPLAAPLCGMLDKLEIREDMWNYSYQMISGLYQYRRGNLARSGSILEKIVSHPVGRLNAQWRIIGLVSCCNSPILTANKELLTDFMNEFFLLGERFNSDFSRGYGYFILAHRQYIENDAQGALKSIISSAQFYQSYGGELLVRESDLIRLLWDETGDAQKGLKELEEHLRFFGREKPGNGLLDFAVCLQGVLHKRVGDYENARSFLHRAFKMTMQKKAMQDACGVCLHLADLYLLMQKEALAADFCRKWIRLSRRHSYIFWREMDRESLRRVCGAKQLHPEHSELIEEIERRYLRERSAEVPQKAAVQIDFFGKFQIHFGDIVISEEQFKTKKARAVLQYILACGGKLPVSREKLAAIFWPSSESKAAYASLRVALYQIRKAFSESGLDFEGENSLLKEDRCGIAISDSLSIQSDAEEFEKIFTEWKKNQKDGQDPCILREMLDLYKGNYLENSCFEDSMLMKQSYYLNLFLEASHALGKMLLDMFCFEEAEEVLLRALEKDPFDETACTLLVEACTMQNQDDRGKDLKKRFIRRYKKEMGYEPFTGTG